MFLCNTNSLGSECCQTFLLLNLNQAAARHGGLNGKVMLQPGEVASVSRGAGGDELEACALNKDKVLYWLAELGLQV